MSNPWFRMYSEFATDPKVQMLSETDQRRFIMLLCMRCGNDDVTLHDDAVAFQLRISDEEWAQTKGRLLAKNLIGDDNKPTAWDKRQFRSDSSAERVAAHRARKKEAVTFPCNVTSKKSNVLDTDTDTDTDTENKSVVTAPASPAPRTKGSRLPENFQPDLQFATNQGIADPREEFSKFRDYWTAQSGQKGVKLDWEATWRNWCRNAKNSPRQRFLPPQPNETVPSKVGPDPELERLKRDDNRAAPIPANLREKFAGITGKLTGAHQ